MTRRWEPVTLKLTAKQARVLWMVLENVVRAETGDQRGFEYVPGKGGKMVRRYWSTTRVPSLRAILRKLEAEPSARPAHEQTEGAKIVKEVEQMYKGSFVPRGRLK